MNSAKPFFTARWENLILITYNADPVLLKEYLPEGLEPDTIDGNSFLSLVAFSFAGTKVKGIKVPFHVNFPEINLRFYVKETGRSGAHRRGVVFIREFVPRSMVSLIANALYNENYMTRTMKSEIDFINGKVICKHKIKCGGKNFSIKAEAEDNPFMPPADSAEHFFKEHEWGFGRTGKGEKLVYRVEHPFWEVYPLLNLNLDFDFGFVYGEKWKFLNNQKPFSVIFAKGSAVKVFSAEK